MRRLLPIALASGLAGLAAVACSAPEDVPNEPALDSPNGIVFACVGLHRDTVNSDPVPVVLPSSACGDLSEFVPDAGPPVDAAPDAMTCGDAACPLPDAGPPPPWENPVQYALISEESRGDVMVAHIDNATLIDTDLLSPGLNGLPVGRLPVGIAMTADGCYAVTANAGSCDLAAVNVLAATQARREGVTRLTVSSPSEILAVRPGAVLGPRSEPPPEDYRLCASEPSGEVYVAFPACQVVARVSVLTGRILDAVKFTNDAPPAIVSPDAVTCAAECTDVPPTGRDAGVLDTPDAAPSTGPDAAPPGPTPGMPEPAALALEPDGTRLYVGAYSSPALTIVDLDDGGAFAGLSTVTLEGAIGIVRIAASGPEEMGQGGLGGTFNFVYAIARDGAIHVVDVTPTRPPRECDAQVDRRYLIDETNVNRMACMPVGDPATPPRRVNVEGPGIRLPFGRVPLDVVFVRGNAELEPGVFENPSAFNGLFALVTTLGSSLLPPRGQAHYITIDDENYPDIEDASDPRLVHMQLAVPHALRDRTDLRRSHPQGCDGSPPPASTENVPLGPPRIDTIGSDTRRINFQDGFNYNWRDLREVTIEDSDDLDGDGDRMEQLVIPARFAPSIHVERCDVDDLIWEMQANIPQIPDFDDVDADGDRDELIVDQQRDLELALLREQLFPDLGNISNEEFVVAWEGPLEPNPFLARRPGGDVAPTGPHSAMSPGGTLKIDDSSGTLCELGAEKGDVARLLGCGVDADCGPSEICAVHPQAPVGSSGMCLPEAQRDVLLARCADLLTSFRKYSIERPYRDKLELRLRPVVMDGSPIDGCAGAAQCNAVYAGLKDDARFKQPVVTLPDQTFTCEPDPYGVMGPLPRCIAICQSTAECVDGSVCDTDSGRCVWGPLPLPECVAPLQLYEVRAGDAFTMVGDVSGYHHRVIAAPSDGSCVVDTSKSPLLTSRFHRQEPLCAALDPEATSPNPCVVEGLEEPVFIEVDTDGDGDKEVDITSRTTRTVRIRTPGITLDVADVAIPIPYADPSIGANDWYSPIPATYAFAFPTAGGFIPQLPAPLNAHLPQYVVTGPDDLIWVIDSGEGDSQNGHTRGQLVGLSQGPTGFIWIY